MLSLVSLTDRRWFDHLSACARRAGGPRVARLDEVNFWRPRDQHAVRSIGPGAPFFLRLKSPVNAIAGFGFFAHWQLVPFLDAWSLFGEKNGAPTLAAFREQIRSLRHADPLAPGATPLGCVVLRDVHFLDEPDWLPWGTAEGWSRNIVNDKTYDLAALPGSLLLQLVQSRASRPPDLADAFELLECDKRDWRSQVVPVREGQGTFKLRLLEAYGSRCAVTGERVVPVLDAAHIQPYLGAASNHVQNGLLLRTDLHRLYDQGLIGVTPDYSLRVSERIHEVWENGREYYDMAGQALRPARAEALLASRDALAWHMEAVYR
jgi:putative restriction endonuclease